jgi:hypothetical protein
MSDIYNGTILPPGAGGLRNRNMGADPYAPVGSSNPAVQAEIARRQEMQRMMQYEPVGSGGAVMTPPINQPNQALADFNQAMSTVPQMLQGTQIEQMYRDYLLNGGTGTFAQFTGAQ